MADTDYIFHISPYDTEKLLPQVSRALEKRTEMVSRERFPGLWKHTDRFRSMARGRKRSRLRTRGMSALCLAAGIFLAVPGLMEPRELFVPLLVGAAAMGAGIIGLWQSRARKKNPFDRAAKILLEGKDKSSAEQAASVSFSEEGMTVPAGGGKAEFVPYREFECAVETADSFLSDVQLQDFLFPDIFVPKSQNIRHLQPGAKTDLKQNVILFTGRFQAILKFLQSLFVLDR